MLKKMIYCYSDLPENPFEPIFHLIWSTFPCHLREFGSLFVWLLDLVWADLGFDSELNTYFFGGTYLAVFSNFFSRPFFFLVGTVWGRNSSYETQRR